MIVIPLALKAYSLMICAFFSSSFSLFCWLLTQHAVKEKKRGIARRAAKRRKAREGDAAVNCIDSEMQRLQISSKSKDDEDEDALLESAINLAAPKRKS